MRTARIDLNKNLSVSILFKLTRRTVLFLLLFTVSLIFLYFIGNFQQFLDSTQIIVIKTMAISASALAVLSAAAIIESFIYMMIKKSRWLYYAVHCVLLAGACCFGAAILIASSSLIIIVQGI